ncbi:DNA sulfur modification protein DndE [Halorarum salinum]|uniref:DNA sulfur modification protein DndE n=1 Tax=Halorarum salinum TaxID=2743089 RepID=A0A7D5Q9U7_9EURY|nr:DNA sulfur modification protein DndE [Halobaculum salinum]QLG62016.1 DNA sulfur modification protein DndE [Halobaculum salinum]
MSKEFNRVQIGSDATTRLRMLKGDTQITPNFLCRIGLCYSLNEPRPPNPAQYDSDGQTFNRYTLLGEHDALYMAMLKERLLQEGLDPEEDLEDQFVAHLNRGVIRVFGNIDNLDDFYNLIPNGLKETSVDAAGDAE